MLEQVHHWRLSSSWAHTSGRQLQSSKSLGRPGRTRFAACTPSSALNDTTTERILSALKLRKLGPLSSSGPLSPAKVNERYRLFLDEWDKGFMEAQEDPEGYYVDCIYGALPPELEGTLFRNGPGKFTVGSSKIDHPYDGDGLVASLAFKDGKAFFRSRFVRTPE